MDGRLVDWGASPASASIGKSRRAADGGANPSGIGVKLDPIAQIAKILNTLARWSATRFVVGSVAVGSVAVVTGLVANNVSIKVGLGEFIISLEEV
jgi:hypothetical protein